MACGDTATGPDEFPDGAVADASTDTNTDGGWDTDDVGPPPRLEDADLAEGRMRAIGGAQPDGSELAEHVVLLDWGELEPSVTVEPVRIVVPFLGNEALLSLRRGHIVASAANGGFLRHVSNAVREGETLVIEGADATLDEVVVQGGFVSDVDLRMGGTPSPAGLAWDRVRLDETYTLDSGTTVAINGEVKLDADAHINLNLAVNRAFLEFSLAGPLRAELTAEVVAAVSGTESASVTVTEIRRTYLAAIGWLPVVLTATARLQLDLSMMAEIRTALSMGVGQVVHIDESVTHDTFRAPDAWEHVSNTFAEAPETVPLELEAGVDVRAAVTLTPELSLTFYGTGVGVATSFPMSLMGLASEDVCSVRAQLEATGQVEARIPFLDRVADEIPLDRAWRYFMHNAPVADLRGTDAFERECCGGGLDVSSGDEIDRLEQCETRGGLSSSPHVIRDTAGRDSFLPDETGQPVVYAERLVEVHGDLTIDVRHTRVTLPNLERVTGQLTLIVESEAGEPGIPSVDLPRLQEVGGLDIRLHADPSVAETPTIELPRLARSGMVSINAGGVFGLLELPGLEVATHVAFGCGGRDSEDADGRTGVDASGVLSLPGLESASSLGLRNEYFFLAFGGGSGCDSTPLIAARACTVLAGSLSQLDSLRIYGPVLYRLPALARVEDDVAIGESKYAVDHEATAGLPAIDLPALRYAGSISRPSPCFRESPPPLPGTATLPALRNVGRLTANFSNTLNLPALESATSIQAGYDPGEAAIVHVPRLISADTIEIRPRTTRTYSFPALRNVESLWLMAARSLSAPSLTTGDILLGGMQAELPNIGAASSLSMGGSDAIPECHVEDFCDRYISGSCLVGEFNRCDGMCNGRTCEPPE